MDAMTEAGSRGQAHAGLAAGPAQRPAHHRVVAVVVNGFAESGPALRQAASQARQRNAMLDIVCIVPAATDGPGSTRARVRLGEFTRRECPYGIGAPARLRVERGDPRNVLPLAAAEAELLINGLPEPAAADGDAGTSAGVPAGPRRRHWLHALTSAPSA